MKKIFAFVLATIMVLSLVPASAFAAITKCPATHTSTNCDCTKIKTVPATCEKAGYTEYVCNDCGESFVDNLKSKADHTWVSNSEKAAGDIPASCVYESNGLQYLICSVCDKEYTKTVDYNSVHDLVHVSGVGCEKLYACTLCGAEGYVDANGLLTTEEGHTWEFTEVEVEPFWSKGSDNSGVAIFTCEDCGATKKVVIDAPVCHESSDEGAPEDYVEVKAAKDPTCTAKGCYLVVKHADCGEHWYCTETYCASKHTKFEDHTWADADPDDDGDWSDTKVTDWNGSSVKLNAITALGHLVSAFISDGYEIGTKNCGDVYRCDRCSTYVTQGHREGTKTYYQKRTCTAKGLYVTTCKDCGQYVYGSQSALEHSTKEKIIPATCVSPALKITYCTRGDGTCTNTKTLVGTEYYYLTKTPTSLGNINSENHNFIIENKNELTNVNQEIYCSGMSYTYKICANGCAQYGSGYTELNQPVLHNFVAYKTVHNYMTTNFVVDGVVLPQWTTRQWVKCSKCNYTPAVGYTDVPDTSIKNEFASLTEALEYHGLIATYWTVDANGNKVVDITKGINGYDGMGAYIGKTVSEIATAMFGNPLAGLSTSATCSTPAKNVYFCSDCSTYVWVQGATAAHALTNYKAGKAATCTTAGSYDTYTCSVCKVTYWFDAAGDVHTESAAKMPCSDTLVFVKGSCGEENGYYQCKVCKTCYSDATATTEYVPTLHNYVTVLAGVAATCNTTGYPEIRYCSVCGIYEVNLIYVNGGKEIRVNFNNSGVANLTTTYMSGAVDVTIAADGSVSYFYDGEVWSEWPTYATVKKMESKTEHRGIYVVANNELATNTAEPYEANEIILKNSEIPTEYSYSVLDHDKPSFNLVNCEACVYEFVRDYVAAKGGHINSDGELIDVDGCNENPVCVICKNYYGEEVDASFYTFGAHNWELSGTSTATCVTAGYTAYNCTKCGEYKIDGEIIEEADPDAYHAKLLAINENMYPYMTSVELVGTKEDYAHNGNYYYACAACGLQLTQKKVTACPGVGVEFTLDTAAAAYGPGATFYVTVNMDSLKGVDVWGANFSVEYDTWAVEFVGYEIVNSAFTGTAYAPVEKQEVSAGVYQYVPTGLVNIALSSSEGVTVKGESELIVLEFKVIAKDSRVKAAQFYVGQVAYGEIEEVVIGSNRKVIKSMYNEFASCKVAISSIADIDGDGETTMFDAFDLYYLILTDEYNTVADIDGDGVLTVEGDLATLYSYLVGEITLEDIIEANNDEDEVTIIYDEYNNIVYHSEYDLNEDGVLSAYEIAVMTGKIDADLNPTT